MSLTAEQAQQLAQQRQLNAAIAEINQLKDEQVAFVERQTEFYESRSHINIARFILESQKQQMHIVQLYLGDNGAGGNMQEMVEHLPKFQEQIQLLLEQQQE